MCVRTLKKGYVRMLVVSFPDHMGGGLGMRLGRVALVPGSCPAFCHLKYGFVHDGQLGSGRETRLEVSKRGEQKRDREKDQYFIVLPVAHFSRTGQSP